MEYKNTMKSLRNLVSRRAKKMMLDQETDNTETSNQIDISVASSSKQEDKTKKPNQGLKRSIQIEQEEINEGKTQEELGEIAGQSDPLNLVLVTLTQGSRKYRTKLEKTRTTNQRGKNEKFKRKFLNKKVTGCNTNLTRI